MRVTIEVTTAPQYSPRYGYTFTGVAILGKQRGYSYRLSTESPVAKGYSYTVDIGMLLDNDSFYGIVVL